MSVSRQAAPGGSAPTSSATSSQTSGPSRMPSLSSSGSQALPRASPSVLSWLALAVQGQLSAALGTVSLSMSVTVARTFGLFMSGLSSGRWWGRGGADEGLVSMLGGGLVGLTGPEHLIMYLTVR